MDNFDLKIMFTDFYNGKEMPILIMGEVLSTERTYSTTTGRDVLVVKFRNDVDTYISDENFLRLIRRIERGKARYRDLDDIITVFGKINIFEDPFLINTYKMYIDVEGEEIEFVNKEDIRLKNPKPFLKGESIDAIHYIYKHKTADELYNELDLSDEDFFEIYRKTKRKDYVPTSLQEAIEYL